MRIHLSVFFLSVLGSAVIGYFVGRRGNDIGPGVAADSRSSHSVAGATTVGPTKQAGDHPTGDAAFQTMRNRAAAMSVEEFAERFVWLQGASTTVESVMEKAALLREVDAPKALAAYLAYKRSRGIPLAVDNQLIREMISVVGEKDGAAAIEQFLAAAPDFYEISSLMKGWALNDPAKAVEWFNNLPDDFSSQKNCLNGLVYGLAQKDPATASKVFQTLSPADQASSAEDIARSLFLNHGPTAVDMVTSKVHGDVKYKCLHGILDRMEKRPSTETVPWLATQVTSSPEAAPALVKAWKRWTTGDPAAAAAWRSSAVSANPQLEQMLAEEKP